MKPDVQALGAVRKAAKDPTQQMNAPVTIEEGEGGHILAEWLKWSAPSVFAFVLGMVVYLNWEESEKSKFDRARARRLQGALRRLSWPFMRTDFLGSEPSSESAEVQTLPLHVA